MKCTVYISNFYNATSDEEESQIEKAAKEKVLKLVEPYVNEDDHDITIIVKRKDVPDPENAEKPKIITTVKALIEFK